MDTTFGWAKASNSWDSATKASTTYKVTLISNGEEYTLDVPDDHTILEAAEDAVISLPFSCRKGKCTSCTGKILKGAVDQHDQKFLNES